MEFMMESMMDFRQNDDGVDDGVHDGVHDGLQAKRLWNNDGLLSFRPQPKSTPVRLLTQLSISGASPTAYI